MAELFVVGGAGGVGGAVTAKLLTRGDTVHVSVLNDQEEECVRREAAGVASITRLDLADASEVKAELSRAVSDLGRLDAVVVCAAVSPLGPVETTPIDVLRRALEINCVSAISIFQASMPALRATSGRLVFLSSTAGFAAMPFTGFYASSKFALEGAVDAMRREAGPQGVKVVLIQPGGVQTPMVSNQIEDVTRRIADLGEEERERYGYLYRGFLAMAQSVFDSSSTSPKPAQIADVVLAALDASEPQPRYLASLQAEQLAGVARSGDLALDAVFKRRFAEAAG